MRPLTRRSWLLRTATALAVWGMTPRVGQAQTQSQAIELAQLQARKSEDGLVLSYQVNFGLPPEVEDALYKGIAIVFVARAELFTERWYWSDKSRGLQERRWRLSFHTLSRHWRVSFDGLGQNYASLNEALKVIQRNLHWRLLDPPVSSQLDYLDFSFELDRDALPRPLQIGLSDQSEWRISVSRRVAITP